MKEIVYFNNCRNRRHAELFQSDAFYDLDNSGPQATQAVGLSVGQECVVASKPPDGSVKFTRYSFASERLMHAREGGEQGKKFRVFLGTEIDAKVLSLAKATREYAAFFDKNGHFKRRSTILAPRMT